MQNCSKCKIRCDNKRSGTLRVKLGLWSRDQVSFQEQNDRGP
jgi:hypothetical protein